MIIIIATSQPLPLFPLAFQVPSCCSLSIRLRWLCWLLWLLGTFRFRFRGLLFFLLLRHPWLLQRLRLSGPCKLFKSRGVFPLHSSLGFWLTVPVLVVITWTLDLLPLPMPPRHLLPSPRLQRRPRRPVSKRPTVGDVSPDVILDFLPLTMHINDS